MLQVAPLSVETKTMNLSSAWVVELLTGFVLLKAVKAKSKVSSGLVRVEMSMAGVINQLFTVVP